MTIESYMGIAQLVEQWSPKPRAEGSSPSAPAKKIQTCISYTGLFCYSIIPKLNSNENFKS